MSDVIPQSPSHAAQAAQTRALKVNHSRRLEDLSWEILRHHMTDLHKIQMSSNHELALIRK